MPPHTDGDPRPDPGPLRQTAAPRNALPPRDSASGDSGPLRDGPPIETLRALDLLNDETEPQFDAIARFAAYASGCPFAMISLIDGERHWFKASIGFRRGEWFDPRFCTQTVLSGEPLLVPDAAQDARFKSCASVVGKPGVRFFLGMPIAFEGEWIGALCVIDLQARTLSAEQMRLIGDLAQSTTSLLENRRLLGALHHRDRLLVNLSRELPGFMYQFRLNTDGSSYFPYASEGLREVFELAPEELQADGDALFNLLHKFDLAPMSAAIKRSAETLQIWRQEFRVLLPRKGLRWIDNHATPVRLDSGDVVWHGYASDVTERKSAELALHHSEQRAKLAIDAARIGIGEWNSRDDRIRFDERAGRLYGVAPGARGLSLSEFFDIVLPEDRVQLEPSMRTALAGGSANEWNFRLAIPTQSTRHVELRVHPLPHALEGEVRAVIASRDVSEQFHAAGLRLEVEAAERADRARSEFLARASHELRTPLNAMLGFTQLLQNDLSGSAPPRWHRQLQSIAAAGQQLLALIDDILDLSRANDAQRPIPLSGVRLAPVIDRAIAMLDATAATHQIVMQRTAIAPTLIVRAHERRLEQCLLNLLSNSLKYNRPGGLVSVTTTIERQLVAVRIRDTGGGLTPEQLAGLFQPFNRIGAEHSIIEGSGLGLSITKLFVEQMRGRLSASSVRGEGSEFVIHLEMAAEDEEPAATNGAAAAEAPRITASAGISDQRFAGRRAPPLSTTPREPRTVLYVEDNALNRLVMKGIFETVPPWQLLLAPDGAGCMSLLAQSRPDLLLLDMNLPDCTGVELLHRIRQDAALAKIPAVAISADALPERIAHAIASGFLDYWIKPIDLHWIIASMDKVFSEASAS